MQVVSTDKAPGAIGPYSQAIKAGGFVYTSGQIPINPKTGEIAGTEIEIQTRQSIENLKNILIEAGSGLNKVIKTTVFIKNMNDFQVINKIYAEYFTNPCPARSCVEVSRLPKDVLVEIEAIALVD